MPKHNREETWRRPKQKPSACEKPTRRASKGLTNKRRRELTARATPTPRDSELIRGQIPNVFPQSNRFEELYLSYNNLDGELPSTLSNLQDLIVLDLSNNEFSGQIPPSLFDMTQLYDLDCAYNKFQGPLPNHITGFQKLTRLSLGHNFLNGTIPSWCFSLSSLQVLCLTSFLQTTEAHKTLRRLITEPLSKDGLKKSFILAILKPWKQWINGTEGMSWPLMRKDLQLSATQRNAEKLLLTERVEQILHGLKLMTCLRQPNFHISPNLLGIKISGDFEEVFNYLGYRDGSKDLILDHNKLQGNIPESIYSLVNLTDIDLSSNKLSGSIHFPLVAKIQNSERLHLSQNDQLSLNFKFDVNHNSSHLWSLKLSSMGLTEFPRLSGKVPVLELFDLSNNKLNGGVPNWFHEMSLLQELDLSQNLLTQKWHLQTALTRAMHVVLIPSPQSQLWLQPIREGDNKQMLLIEVFMEFEDDNYKKLKVGCDYYSMLD
ncbi:hypothetical protein Fmac_016086 [Flemingia macrophylla]|uniref:Uncharacterized protein n=1 Tax=Flemingia macrophylla TaxID=520843 RepID=A0ABD1MGD8_9FABA